MAKIKFLTAYWKNLVMLNYEVDPAILKPYLPAATELDLWQGKALVSMVGFLFNDTRVLGVKWPGHVNFEEVNLRFYVRHFNGTEWKRGTVFVSELVPKRMIPLIANTLYKEHYRKLPMRHAITKVDADYTNYLYEWKLDGKWNKLGATVNNNFVPIEAGSAEEFILEHYWGYNRLTDVNSMEYQVEHVPWRIAEVKDSIFEADIKNLYGDVFEPYLTVKPYSVFFAEGSEINVRAATRLMVLQVPQV
ncbi:DUF2071 domain-containing protein [Mucilaginibacter limnophilus]|uniref:DUF2071 domain-containing protein n=1 Tax=Mucilaginibacter limnophilus TaxID=1932778 RepID=A0A3S2XZL1_9SPHI|nr:DUF2071 domain-containing protein [Mucilaginibacter limnophilus]RVT99935.1 DUF2071 domain-containing protein [Mucilaginibacter limnophilus]